MKNRNNGLLEAPGDVALRPATEAVNEMYNSTEVTENMLQIEWEQLNEYMDRSGLELLNNNRIILTNKIRNVIAEMIANSDDLPKVNYSAYISEKLHHDYTYLANVFSKAMGTTIQQYIIIQKIEKVKKLLLDGSFNLTEVSFKLQYSSVAHLSNQFKKITGVTPTFYMQMRRSERYCLENLGYL